MTIKNKYVVLMGALLAQVTIGALYAWSIFGTALQAEYGWTGNEVLWPYALAQFVFALSTLLSGRIVDKKGPRVAIMIGGSLYGSGMILSSFATTPGMLMLTFGVMVGAGVGFIYVCPLSTLIKWFPTKKGLITGLSVGVFGGGSILFKSLIPRLMMDVDASGTTFANIPAGFFKLGLISMVLILIGGLLVNNPEGYARATVSTCKGDFTTAEMVKTSKFKLTWVIYLLAVTPGLLVLGAAKNIGMEMAGLNATSAAGLITILAVANASSRLVSGALSDKVGTLKMLKIVFALTIASLLGLSFFASSPPIFYLSVVGIAMGYGGFLSLFPTFTNQEFGSFRYGSNYGVIFQAYGIAALSGIFLKHILGSYATTFMVSAVLATIGLALSFMIKDKATVEKLEAATNN